MCSGWLEQSSTAVDEMSKKTSVHAAKDTEIGIIMNSEGITNPVHTSKAEAAQTVVLDSALLAIIQGAVASQLESVKQEIYQRIQEVLDSQQQIRQDKQNDPAVPEVNTTNTEPRSLELVKSDSAFSAFERPSMSSMDERHHDL